LAGGAGRKAGQKTNQAIAPVSWGGFHRALRDQWHASCLSFIGSDGNNGLKLMMFTNELFTMATAGDKYRHVYVVCLRRRMMTAI
jgi:hypothetical protein